ncbi:MAG: ABC transporter permease [Cyanomargarita calcarea GSE-NOS-MK-12-04C]|jgi:putative ABC transport system permease protein|uniref:ABC transporter permease n=1 Tax=Cyanomargarita calcarea GSE-NOS-MK-12-04C TaxID=2839659 RepID=A0A951UUY0_9CYAN|nr:ABC transporter permease [Cyanomargarita calcarea GSE-NOS-MK-12-04C]
MSLSPQDLIILTCKSLAGNLVRSTLTTLGVFMGVAAVNATLGVGDISRAVITKKLAEREAPQVYIGIYSSEGREPQLEDMKFLQRRLKNFQAISASNMFGYSDKVLYQNQEAEPQMSAVTQDFLLTSGRKLISGRFFSSTDFENYRPVVVIDKFLADKLFQKENPLGKLIFGSGRPYLVVGIMETKMTFIEQPKGDLVLPISIYSSITGNERIDQISIRPRLIEKMNDLSEEAKKILEPRFPGAEIYVHNNIEEILAQKQTLEYTSRGLTVVGIIALLIGGVGIMNITIAAVIERTAEIGLRRAIGATKQEILFQFILEATILSLFGGMSAIGSVHFLTSAVTNTLKLPYQFQLKTATFSLGSALIVGVGACFFPAVRASQLDPVKALRES